VELASTEASPPLPLLLAMCSAAAVEDDDDENTRASVALAPPVELELVFQLELLPAAPVDDKIRVAFCATPVLLLLLLLLIQVALKATPVLEEVLAAAPVLLLEAFCEGATNEPVLDETLKAEPVLVLVEFDATPVLLLLLLLLETPLNELPVLEEELKAPPVLLTLPLLPSPAEDEKSVEFAPPLDDEEEEKDEFPAASPVEEEDVSSAGSGARLSPVDEPQSDTGSDTPVLLLLSELPV
jgi:hypothetical protein